MVASLDGYIAKKDNSISWMETKDHYEEGVTLSDEEISDFLNSIDCYVMGSHTYEHALELGWPYGNVPVFVLTRRSLHTEKDSVQFYHGTVEKLVSEKLDDTYQNVWVVGGAEVTRAFLRAHQADEIVISIMPKILGDGLMFFDQIEKELSLNLLEVKAFKNGIVELTYKILEN